MKYARGNWQKYRGEAIDWLRAHASYQADNCLKWPFGGDPNNGRGAAFYEGRQYPAHRLMCIMAHGEPPTPKHQARHSCGNGHMGCVNPKHLSWATNADNQRDRRKHGTHVSSTCGPSGILSLAERDQIIALKGQMTQRAIAAKFNVSIGCVQYWHGIRAKRRDLPVRSRRVNEKPPIRDRQESA